MINILNNLSYCECYDCGNYFFIHELPLGINDPLYCPYCGTGFDNIDSKDDLEDL